MPAKTVLAAIASAIVPRVRHREAVERRYCAAVDKLRLSFDHIAKIVQFLGREGRSIGSQQARSCLRRYEFRPPHQLVSGGAEPKRRQPFFNSLLTDSVSSVLTAGHLERFLFFPGITLAWSYRIGNSYRQNRKAIFYIY